MSYEIISEHYKKLYARTLELEKSTMKKYRIIMFLGNFLMNIKWQIGNNKKLL